MAWEAHWGPIVIYDSVLFYPGHHVSRWANDTQRGFTMAAKAAAPVRSGELVAGIHGESHKAGPKQYEAHIFSEAPHTMYVVKGTHGPIMSNRMWGFRSNPRYASAPGGLPRVGRTTLPSGAIVPDMRALHANGYALRVRPGNGFPGHFAISVSGQEANNFFDTAATVTARSHSSLRGWHPGQIFRF